MATDNKFKDFEELKEHLRGCKGSDKKNLHDHIKENVFTHMVTHCPSDALDKLEEISYCYKHDSIPKEQFLKMDEIHNYAKPAEESQVKSTQEQIEKASGYFNGAKKAEVDDDGNPVEVGESTAAVGNLPDLLAEQKVWQWAGVGFGEFDTMLLQKSMKQLAAKSGSSKMRLWGLIKGTQRNYYVVEGEKALEGDPLADAEERGKEGANQYVYWVCNSPLKEWSQLPDLTPSDILNARQIKHTFTGDLDSLIYTNPFYFQTEKVYLRAQIARITAATILVPKDKMQFVEETDEREIKEKEAEEDKPLVIPTVKQMGSMSMWCHLNPAILNQGRVKHADPKPIEGVEDDELKKREIAKDPWTPRLKCIEQDAKTRGKMPAWAIRSYDTYDTFKNAKDGSQLNYGTVVVKSMWWPGSYTFYNNSKTQHIYCGDGLKHELPGAKYYPILPPVMLDDREEKKCYDEPNPTAEWLAAKAALEAKKAEGAGGD